MINLKTLAIITMIITLSACDATIGKISSMGKEATVTCYSGGKEVIKMRSTGKILSEPGSGYYFKNEKGLMVEIDMPCVILYDK